MKALKKKVKIKFTENGDVKVSVPYKNGYVKWCSEWTSYTFEWYMDECPEIYCPTRVEACHLPFLGGVGLQRRIIQSAAARHEWALMDRYRAAFDRVNCNRVTKERMLKELL